MRYWACAFVVAGVVYRYSYQLHYDEKCTVLKSWPFQSSIRLGLNQDSRSFDIEHGCTMSVLINSLNLRT